jgi:hypothetical protein
MKTTIRFFFLITALAALAGTAFAQSTVTIRQLGLPFTSITSGGISNIAFQAASATHTAGTSVTTGNPPLGVDLTLVGRVATNATPVIGVGLQTSPDGTNFSQRLLWLIVAGGVSCPSNIVYTTNFSQAVLGNTRAIRVGSITNGPGTALTVSNVVASFYY